MVSKKLINRKSIIIILILILFQSVYSANILFNQSTTIDNYNNAQKSTQLVYDLVGSKNSETLGNHTGDLKVELVDIKSEVYIIVNNYVTNTSMNVSFLFENQPIIHQELLLKEVGEFVFEVTPNYNNENGQIMFNIPDSSIAQVFIQPTKPTLISNQSQTTIFTPMIKGVEDLITINISLWKIIYYLFIFVIVVGLIGGLVMIGRTYYKWTEKHNIYKHNNNRK